MLWDDNVAKLTRLRTPDQTLILYKHSAKSILLSQTAMFYNLEITQIDLITCTQTLQLALH